MAAKKSRRRSILIIGIVALVVGFLVGEMIPLPIFDNINLRATMMRPGDVHHRGNF